MSLVAGLAVLVPMIVMTKGFHRSENAAIITVVISTVGFALFVAFTSVLHIRSFSVWWRRMPLFW